MFNSMFSQVFISKTIFSDRLFSRCIVKYEDRANI